MPKNKKSKKKNESSDQAHGNIVRITDSDINAPVAGGNITQGNNVIQGIKNAQVNMTDAQTITVTGLTAAQLAQVQDLVNALKATVEMQELADDEKPEAKMMASRLEKELTVTDRKPDGGKLQAAAQWLLAYGGKIAGAVTGIFVNPIVGKVVEAAGDLTAGWVKEKFGGVKPAAPES